MSNSIPYLGSKISLITTFDIRYEGILYTLNREESTIAVQNVRSFGTEGRRIPEVPTTNEIYDFIIFRGKDLKDLTVLQGAPERQPPYTGADYLDASSVPYSQGQGQRGYMQDQYGANGNGSAHGAYQQPHQYQSHHHQGGNGSYQHGAYQQQAQQSQPPQPPLAPPSSAPPAEPRVPSPAHGDGRGAAETPATGTAMSYEEDDKARGRGKGGGGQKKTVFEVLRFHRRAEESLARAVKAQGAAALSPSELRSMSEMNPPVYHFYLDFVNYCCAAHLAQSDEQQWETLGKALKKHFERDLQGGNSGGFGGQGFGGQGFSGSIDQGQQKPAPPPQRPNNTLGDFISLEAAAARPGRKGAKAPSGGGVAGPAPGRGGKAAGRTGAGGFAGGDEGAGDLFEEPPAASNGGGAAAGGSWACPRCTLRNEVFLTECAACGSSRQQAALWAEFPPLA